MVETDSEIVVKAAVPGVKPGVGHTVSGDLLTIKGETKEDPEEETDSTIVNGGTARSNAPWRSPTSVDVDKATAELRRHVCCSRLPKAAAAKQTRLQINKKS